MHKKVSDVTPEIPLQANDTPKTSEESEQDFDKEIQQALLEIGNKRGTSVYPLFLGDLPIEADTVSGVYDDLCSYLTGPCTKLDVIVDSSGGDIHAAYGLARLFRRFATSELNFIVPRWAKSAATLLVCGGDTIYMGPIAELGPLDPQIMQFNQYENRFESFSPLSVEATLDLIRNEFENGHEKLANGLLHRLQFPLTLGGIKKSLDIGKQYVVKLLTTRMLSEEGKEEQAQAVGQALTEKYSDHGFWIDIDEANSIGLKVQELEPTEFSLVWQLYRLIKQKEEVERKARATQMEELLKNVPESMRAAPKIKKGRNLLDGNEHSRLEDCAS